MNTNAKNAFDGEPICVVSCNKKTGELKVIDENLNRLDKKLKSLKAPNGETVQTISVIGIAGKFRSGKSFMLSLIVRYLSTDPELLALSSTAFLDQVKNFRDEPSEGALFKWETRDRSVTSGIWFFSNPFVVKTGGKYVAVLLMDTQGLFDTGTSAQCDLRVFGLSLSLSSHQILNVKGNIDRQLFDKINLFSSYANDVSRQIDEFDAPETNPKDTGKESKEDNANNGETKPRFQTLQFLLRDFGTFETDLDEEAEHGWVNYVNECHAKSKQYINIVLDDIDSINEGDKDKLLSTYQKLSCVCLPHPGNKMTRGTWNGDPGKIEQEFKVLTAGYIESLFGRASHTGGPTPKLDRFGAPMRGSSLAKNIRETVAVLNRTGKTYDVGDTIGLLAHNKALKARQDCMKDFENRIEELCGGDASTKYINQDDFKKYLKTAEDQALRTFDKTIQKLYRMKLDSARVKAIEEEEKETKTSIAKKSEEMERNNALRADKILNWLAPYMAVLITLFMLDWSSDFLCDSWSEQCRSFSSAAAKITKLGFMFALCCCVYVYKEFGGQRLVPVVTGLWGETLKLIIGMVEKIKTKFKPAQASASASASASTAGKEKTD